VKTFNLVGLESSENSFLNHLTDLGKKVLGIPSNFVVSSDPKVSYLFFFFFLSFSFFQKKKKNLIIALFSMK